MPSVNCDLVRFGPGVLLALMTGVSHSSNSVVCACNAHRNLTLSDPVNGPWVPEVSFTFVFCGRIKAPASC